MTNKELVLDFIDHIFNAHDLTDLDRYMRADYKQHSIGVGDGRDSFRAFAEDFFTQEPYMDVKRVFESDDNCVAVFFECRFKTGPSAKVVDMYRIEDGMIAEHWDVVQGLPEDDALVNGRGSF